MGASPTKQQPKNIQVKCVSESTPSNFSSDCEDSGHSLAASSSSTVTDIDEPTNLSSEKGDQSPISAVDSGTSPGKVSEERYESKQENKQKAKSKESNFVETSEFPYAKAKLVHPQTSREYQEARSEGRRVDGSSTGQTWTTKPHRPKQQVKHVVFGGHSQSRAERTINPHLLWRLHSHGSGINVVPCTEVSRRISDHMPANTWRNPNRVHTYFRDQSTLPTEDPVLDNNDVRRYDQYAVRPPTPCTPANTSLWSSAANSGSAFGYSDEERKALIRAQYKVELEAIRQMTQQYSKMSTTGHR